MIRRNTARLASSENVTGHTAYCIKASWAGRMATWIKNISMRRWATDSRQILPSSDLTWGRILAQVGIWYKSFLDAAYFLVRLADFYRALCVRICLLSAICF